MQTFAETPVETLTVEAPVAVQHCINCVRPLPHAGTSWKESGACRRNEAGHTALAEDATVADHCAVTR